MEQPVENKTEVPKKRRKPRSSPLSSSAYFARVFRRKHPKKLNKPKKYTKPFDPEKMSYLRPTKEITRKEFSEEFLRKWRRRMEIKAFFEFAKGHMIAEINKLREEKRMKSKRKNGRGLDSIGRQCNPVSDIEYGTYVMVMDCYFRKVMNRVIQGRKTSIFPVKMKPWMEVELHKERNWLGKKDKWAYYFLMHSKHTDYYFIPSSYWYAMAKKAHLEEGVDYAEYVNEAWKDRCRWIINKRRERSFEEAMEKKKQEYERRTG